MAQKSLEIHPKRVWCDPHKAFMEVSGCSLTVMLDQKPIKIWALREGLRFLAVFFPKIVSRDLMEPYTLGWYLMHVGAAACSFAMVYHDAKEHGVFESCTGHNIGPHVYVGQLAANTCRVHVGRIVGPKWPGSSKLWFQSVNDKYIWAMLLGVSI
jgi:hypothetical protein